MILKDKEQFVKYHHQTYAEDVISIEDWVVRHDSGKPVWTRNLCYRMPLDIPAVVRRAIGAGCSCKCLLG